jgi:hypothetical protein
MSNIHIVGTAAQPPLTANGATAFDDAIRDARVALVNGSLDGAFERLADASRLAAEVKYPQAHELANLVGALEPAFETLKLVEMCFLDLFPAA